MNNFKQKFQAEIDRQIADLIAAEPRIQIKDIAERVEVSEYQVYISLRRQGISRTHIAGRRPKQIV